MKISNGEVSRNQAAVKEHREYEIKRDYLAAYQISARQRVCCRDVDNQADGCSHYRVKDGVPITHPDTPVTQQLFISVQRELAGPEPHVAVRHFRRVTKRRNDDKVERILIPIGMVQAQCFPAFITCIDRGA